MSLLQANYKLWISILHIKTNAHVLLQSFISSHLLFAFGVLSLPLFPFPVCLSIARTFQKHLQPIWHYQYASFFCDGSHFGLNRRKYRCPAAAAAAACVADTITAVHRVTRKVVRTYRKDTTHALTIVYEFDGSSFFATWCLIGHTQIS